MDTQDIFKQHKAKKKLQKDKPKLELKKSVSNGYVSILKCLK